MVNARTHNLPNWFQQALLPLVTEDILEKCLIRLRGKILFTEGLNESSLEQAVSQQILSHAEPFLFGLCLEMLKENDLADARTEPLKMLILVAVNIVESVTYALSNPHKALPKKSP